MYTTWMEHECKWGLFVYELFLFMYIFGDKSWNESILCDRQRNLSDYVLFKQYSDLLLGELAEWDFKERVTALQFLSIKIMVGLVIANVTKRIQGCDKAFRMRIFIFIMLF